MLKARLLGAVGIVALIGGIAAGLAAQTPASPAFEVASIKPNDSGASGGSAVFHPGGGFRAVNVPLLSLIVQAFGTAEEPLLLTQIVGGPSWTVGARFDIVANADSALPSDAQGLSQYLPSMLRNLLEERFKLKTHRESRQLQIYALVKARSDSRLGPKLRASTIDCLALAQRRRDNPSTATPLPNTCGTKFGLGSLSGSMTMAGLARTLSGPVQQVVLDRTGLTGNFDFDLQWSAGLRADSVSGDAAPSIFTAIQEQLGLKLEPTKGPVDVLVINHVERPTED